MNKARIIFLLAIIALIVPLLCLDAQAEGSTKLRLVLKDHDPALGQDSSSTGDPEGEEFVLGRIVSSRPDTFEWVPAAEAHDVLIAIDSYIDDISEAEIWRVILKTDIDAKKQKSLQFPTLKASEVELKIELQRLHLIKNLSSFKSDAVKVRLSAIGKPIPVYSKGDQFRIEVESSKSGYLNLITIDPTGEIFPLLPQGRQPQRIVANKPIHIPGEGSWITVKEPPYGTEYLKAIFSTVPLDLSHLRRTDAASSGAMDPDALLAWAEKMGSKTRGIRPTGENLIGTAELQIQTQEKP